MTLQLVFLFTIGLFFGSFLGVLIERIPIKENFTTSRSRCSSCRKELNFFDLVPVFSFLFLKGKCRYCKEKLSFFYPLIELLTGVLFAGTYWYLINQNLFTISYFLLSLFVLTCFVVIFFIDLNYKMIPNVIVYPAIIVTILYLLFFQNSLLFNHLTAGIAVFLFFFFLFFITNGKGMGFGDVQFSFLLGIFLGYPFIVYSIYLAFLTGALVSLILVVGRRYSLKRAIPFGPFLIIGALCMFFFGNSITKIFPYL